MPTPTNVIALRGNPSKLSKAEIEERASREVHAEPVRSTDPPKDLRGHARDCWKMHAPELERLGLLTKLDLGSFRLLCETYALALDALAQMRPRRADGEADERTARYEVVLEDLAHGGGLKKHPAFSAYNMAVNTYRAWCAEFGLSPASRVTLRPANLSGGKSDAARDDDGGFDFGT